MNISETTFDALNPIIDTLLTKDLNEKMGQKKENFNKLAFSLIKNGETIGGITGTINYECFHINGLAVDKSHQGKDYGTELIRAIESAAVENGAKLITVSTLSFQALSFYQKMGYEIFGELENCPFENSTKYYLKKKV